MTIHSTSEARSQRHEPNRQRYIPGLTGRQHLGDVSVNGACQSHRRSDNPVMRAALDVDPGAPHCGKAAPRMAAETGSTSPARRARPVAGKEWDLLMAAAQNGHAASYKQLLEELRCWLSRFYARRLPPALVEDAVQDTLIAIHEKRHTFDPQRPFKPWLIAVARYKWIDRLRQNGRSRVEELPEDLSVDDHESSVTSAVTLGHLLGKLKPAQAAVIRLVKLEGFSIEETAARTGQSCSLVKVNVHRGLERLVSMVEQ